MTDVDRWEEIRAAAVRAGVAAGLDSLKHLPGPIRVAVASPGVRIVDSPVVRSAVAIVGPAVRSVSETAGQRVIEGLAYPFKARDTYGTWFSRRTEFWWDLFPDVVPGVRSDAAPAYVRPVTYHHGLDREFGLTRYGGWSPIRTDADGVWVRAILDTRARYYAERIKPLLDAGALGLSGGSAEHSVKFNEKTGEVLEWPAYELALTPVEANPLAQISRSGELRIVAS
jgi:hypothetical protein